MRITCSRLHVIVLIATIVVLHVTADSQGIKRHRSNVTGKEAIDPAEEAKAKAPSQLSTGDSNLPPNPTEGNPKDEQGGNKPGSESKNAPAPENTPSSSSGICDSQDSCTDDDESFIACLRVSKNDSRTLSLVIQNRGKGPQNITISAPKTVKLINLKTNTTQVQRNSSGEFMLSISGLDSGHFINLTTAGQQGICSLNFTAEYMALKMDDHLPESIHHSFLQLTLSAGVLVSAVLIIAVAAVFLYPKLKRGNIARKGPRYHKVEP